MELVLGIAMGDGDPPPRQGHHISLLQASPSDRADRLPQPTAVEVTIPEYEVAGDVTAFIDDVGDGDVATMEQGFGTRSLEIRHGELRTLHLVMSVRQDTDEHDTTPSATIAMNHITMQ